MKLPKLLVKKPKFSNFDISGVTRMSAKPGVLYPVFIQDMLPGETINLNIQSLIKTYPTLAPLMGTFKVQFDIFRCPLRYYVPKMDGQDQEAIPVGKKLPQIYMPHVPFVYDEENEEWSSVYGPYNMIYPGTLFDYLLNSCYMSLPVSQVDQGHSKVFHFPAHYYKAYWDIYRSYYINQQEPDHYFTIEKIQDVEINSSTAVITNSRLSDLFQEHDIRTISNGNGISTPAISPSTAVPSSVPSIFDRQVNIPSYGIGNFASDSFGAYAILDSEDIPTYLQSGDIVLPGTTFVKGNSYFNTLQYKYTFPRGLACRTYRNDYITSVLNSDRCSSAKQFVNVANNKVSITEITFANKLQNYLELSVAAGSRYKEWIRSQFGVTAHDDLMMPELLGSISTWLNFEDVVQTSSDAVSQPLGSLAGKGSGVLSNNKTFDVYAEEHAVCMVMMSIVPQVDYYQGIPKCMLKETFDDIFKPALDNIGYQDLFEFEVSALNDHNSWLMETSDTPGTSAPVPAFKPNYTGDQYKADRATAIGKQPAWLEYKTALNRVHGDFVDSLRYWTNARQMFTPAQYFRISEQAQNPTKKVDSAKHYSTYIDPSQWNNAFADTSLDSENFLVQIRFGAYRKSPMSKNLLRKL